MDAPLWTETHAPSLSELPQEEVREYLTRGVEEPINLVLYGPKGAGKTAAVRALAREAHDSADDLVTINVADFFNQTKKEIGEDPRFSRFLQGEIPSVKVLSTEEKQKVSKRYKKDWSKGQMITHIIKESASYKPVTSDYKTILLDNAEAIREDFQQSLRRVMENYQENTQFVITTRQPSALIPPITSRCFPVPMRAPTSEEVCEVLERIAEREDVDHDREGLEYVAGYAGGDLRRAILGAQTTAESAGEITMQSAYEALGEVGVDDRIRELLDDAEAGEFTDARKLLDELLIDEGYAGHDVLEDLLTVARSRYNGRELAEIHRRAGEADLDLVEGTSDRIQIGHLLADLGAD